MFVETILQNCQNAPGRLFYVCENERLTYGALYQKATRLAGYLQAQGQSPVAVYGYKQSHMLVAFLACLICKRAYVPCDSSYPIARIQTILKQSGAGLLLAVEPLQMPGFAVLTNAQLEEIFSQNRPWSLPQAHGQAAYILFTSGSTGQPKGVAITHENLENFLQWLMRFPTVRHTRRQVVFNQALFSFDLSMADIFLSLLGQNTLVGATRAQQSDFIRLFALLKESSPSLMVCTPTFMQLCLCDKSFCKTLLPQLHTILFCGETLPKKVVEKLFSRFENIHLLNLYGPTEATVAVTGLEITPQMLALESLPIGRAGRHAVDVQVLNDALAPVQEGAWGEIVLSGKSVAGGYLNGGPGGFYTQGGQTYYRTGDIGKYQDGYLFCKGRKDGQIKYKGYRIELGEIENALQSLPQVEHAVVLPLCNAQGAVMRLAAAVTLCQSCTENQLQNALAPLLPRYMWPSRIHILQALPLNANGKCDKTKLKEAILWKKP